jgi:hypothetical protein
VVLGSPSQAPGGDPESLRRDRQTLQHQPAAQPVGAVVVLHAPGAFQHAWRCGIEGRRLTEEGRIPGGREGATRSASKPPPQASAPSDPFRQVFDSFVAAKQKAGEATTKLNYESFKKTLEKQADQIRAAKGFKDVDFGVTVKDGKVSVVARPKK